MAIAKAQSSVFWFAYVWQLQEGKLRLENSRSDWRETA